MRAIKAGTIHEALADDGIGRAALADVKRLLEEADQMGAKLDKELADLVAAWLLLGFHALPRSNSGSKGRAFHGHSHIKVTVTPGAMGDKVALAGAARQWPPGPCGRDLLGPRGSGRRNRASGA